MEQLTSALGEASPLTDTDVATLYWMLVDATDDPTREKVSLLFKSGENKSVAYCANTSKNSKPTPAPNCADLKSLAQKIAEADPSVKKLAATLEAGQAGNKVTTAAFY